ncbi:MAG: metal ABC transporter substrate-binding protein [Candidatus Bathyarchaeota archaeon]|nr:metal ABC transporter substrate-binding protein [Candidatus Bathyarchaeota archaeon]
MKKLLFILLFCITLTLFVNLPTTLASGEKPIVVATTTVLGSIVKELAGDSVELIIIASPSVCPAHHDIKPSDVYAFSKANLILYHGIEPWIDTLVKTSGTNASLVKISGSWNTPEGIKRYYVSVATVLKEKLGLDVSGKLSIILAKIDETSSALKGKAEKLGVSNVKVIAMSWQKEFVSWLGFNVVASFGPPEKLSSADVEELVKTGKKEEIMLVISNLQSGVAFGESLASEVGAIHVALTNFPWIDPELDTLTDVLNRNAENLFKAVEIHGIQLKALKAESESSFYRTLSYSLIAIVVVEAALIGYTVKRRS